MRECSQSHFRLQAGRAEEDPYDDPDEEDPYDNIEAGASEEFTQASDQSNTDENPAWPSRPTILKVPTRPTRTVGVTVPLGPRCAHAEPFTVNQFSQPLPSHHWCS